MNELGLFDGKTHVEDNIYDGSSADSLERACNHFRDKGFQLVLFSIPERPIRTLIPASNAGQISLEFTLQASLQREGGFQLRQTTLQTYSKSTSNLGVLTTC